MLANRLAGVTITKLPTSSAAVSVPRAYRFELVKLVSQARIRLVLLVCWMTPAVFVAAVSQQSSLPVDTLFGRLMHTSGWAAPLVLLGFVGTWALPVLTSLVAGDVFAAEDRLGTWPHLLVAVRSVRRIFAAKALASLTVILSLVAGLACSSAAGGLLTVGNRALVGLDGHLISPPQAGNAVLLAWGCCVLAPTLAMVGIGLLGSAALGRSPTGLLLPALTALALQLAQQLPLPVALRLALPGSAFLSWSGLFTSPMQLGPLLIGIAVSLLWALTTTALALRLFLTRDFTNLNDDGTQRRIVLAGVLPLTGLFALTAATIAVATGATGSGLEPGQVQRALAGEFAHLYRIQTTQLHRPDATEAQLNVTAICTKGGDSAGDGPGNDWRCIVSWHLPGIDAIGTASYQLDLSSDGRFVADGDGPKEVNGFFLVQTATGDAPNPLWQFDGNVDLLR